MISNHIFDHITPQMKSLMIVFPIVKYLLIINIENYLFFMKYECHERHITTTLLMTFGFSEGLLQSILFQFLDVIQSDS